MYPSEKAAKLIAFWLRASRSLEQGWCCCHQITTPSHARGAGPAAWPCDFQALLGPVTVPPTRPCCGFQKKRRGESLPSLHLNLPGDTSVQSGRVPHPCQSCPSLRLNWQAAPSPATMLTFMVDVSLASLLSLSIRNRKRVGGLFTM